MKKEDLTKLGIADDVADQILAIHGKDIEKHKTAAATAQTEIDALKTQLAEAGKQIESFKGMDIDGIRKAADEYKAAAEKAKVDADAQIAALKFDHALDGALAAAKARSPKAVKALLNTELLKLADDGTISGLKDQLEKVQAENDYLFESDGPTMKPVAGAKPPTTSGDSFMAALRAGAGLPEAK